MKPLILIVDDCEDDRLLMTSILESFGYPSITASDGSTALQLAQRYQPTLILLDICMPGMDGYEVVRHLKRIPRTAAIPVIAMTAMVASAQKQVLAAGFDDCLMKPFTIELFETVINYHLVSISNSLSIRAYMTDKTELEKSFDCSCQ